jgi:hypothetical protein
MTEEIIITTASSDEEIRQILSLQALNHKSNITNEEAINNGFVTVKHTKSLLESICKPYAHVIAKKDDKLVGYALVMLKEHINVVPELNMMDEIITQITYNNKPLNEYSYLVMGQICVAEEVRGQKVFDRMYDFMKSYIGDRFDYIITEVADRNQRSLRAHKRVGFHIVHTYVEEAIDEVWNVVLLPTLKN